MSRDGFLNRDKRKGTPSHRRAPKMEKQLAQRFGGRTVPGSGSAFEKGDVKGAFGGLVRIEAKTTKNKSFSITRAMVAKIENSALPNNELPAIIVEFINEQGKPEMEVAVVPVYVLEQLGGINES